ncbi:MAG: hypothetical protein KAH32_08265, partial [Chlamydiia bacterium]|nr:hypothetical protein [Chlamydiia bacterium]
YDKWSNENAVWNLEAQGFGKEGVTDGSLLGYKGKENAFFSSDLVKNKLDDNKSTIFYTTAELNPSDMYENSSLTLRKNTKGVVEKATYTGDGVTTITLHNIYDPARGTDSQAFMIYDKYVKDKTSGTVPAFNGNINPLNHTIPIPSSSTSRGSFFMYTAGSGLIGTRLQNWFSFHNMAKDAVTIKVRATGIVPMVKKIELEGGGVYNEVTYGYEILSMGKYSDDGKTIPGDAVYTFNASGQRGFKFQDDESSMKLTAKFTDTVTITKIDGSTESVPAGGTYTWNWYSLMLASAKARKWATAIKITIIVAMSIALIIITWGGATYPVLGALYTISTLAMTANEVWQAVRAYKLRNSYLTSDMLGALSSLMGASYVSTQA